MFDDTMNLLEEILASREETFSLLLIPNFFSLVDSFSSRQLAHFCRILSLVLFEPEDRQIMEGSQILKSLELLQLRRNRMAKNSSNVVERNQSLVRVLIIFFSKVVINNDEYELNIMFTDNRNASNARSVSSNP